MAVTLPKGVNVQAIADRIPSIRAFAHVILRVRFIAFAVVLTLLIFTWNGLTSTASSIERYVASKNIKSVTSINDKANDTECLLTNETI